MKYTIFFVGKLQFYESVLLINYVCTISDCYIYIKKQL